MDVLASGLDILGRTRDVDKRQDTRGREGRRETERDDEEVRTLSSRALNRKHDPPLVKVVTGDEDHAERDDEKYKVHTKRGKGKEKRHGRDDASREEEEVNSVHSPTSTPRTRKGKSGKKDVPLVNVITADDEVIVNPDDTDNYLPKRGRDRDDVEESEESDEENGENRHPAMSHKDDDKDKVPNKSERSRDRDDAKEKESSEVRERLAVPKLNTTLDPVSAPYLIPFNYFLIFFLFIFLVSLNFYFSLSPISEGFS